MARRRAGEICVDFARLFELSAPDAYGDQRYTVREGDTLSGIAARRLGRMVMMPRPPEKAPSVMSLPPNTLWVTTGPSGPAATAQGMRDRLVASDQSKHTREHERELQHRCQLSAVGAQH